MKSITLISVLVFSITCLFGQEKKHQCEEYQKLDSILIERILENAEYPYVYCENVVTGTVRVELLFVAGDSSYICTHGSISNQSTVMVELIDLLVNNINSDQNALNHIKEATTGASPVCYWISLQYDLGDKTKQYYKGNTFHIQCDYKPVRYGQ